MSNASDSSSKSAPAAPAFGVLDQRQAEDVLRRNTVGRLAFALHDRVNIIPIHYVYDAGWLYGRTEPGGKLIPILRNRRVAFEVDEHEGVFSWRSVIVHGPLYLIEPDGDDKEKEAYERATSLLRRILPATFNRSDPVPFRTELFRIQMSELTSRSSAEGGKPIQPRAERTPDRSADPEADAALASSALAAVRRIAGDDSLVNVDAFDKVVVLSGIVDSPAEKTEIEKAILELPNAEVVVQQIETSHPSGRQQEPAELAREALRELDALPSLPDTEIKVVVEHDWLRVEGSAPTRDLKEDALRRLRSVRGVRGVIDRIQVDAE